MVHINQRDDLMPCMMQKEVKCYEMDSKRVLDRFGGSADCLEISAEGNRQYMSTRIRDNTEEISVYSLEEMGKEAWEKATGIKVLFYLESDNIEGTETSVFQRYQNRQYKVFMRFLEENNVYEDIHSESKEMLDTVLKDITRVMDEYGDGGYNGISRSSMLLSQNMIAQLEFFNQNYVPDYLQAGFQRLIEECDYFNQNGRENMFVERMPCDIVLKGLGDGLVNKEKSLVVRNYLEYSRREKDEISTFFAALRGKRTVSDIGNILDIIEKQYYRDDPNGAGRNLFSSMKASWKKIL